MAHSENMQVRSCADSFKVTKKSLKQFIVNCALVNKVRTMPESTMISHERLSERDEYYSVKNHAATFNKSNLILDFSGLHENDSCVGCEGTASVDMDISYGYPEEEYSDPRGLPPPSPGRTKTPRSARRLLEQVLGNGNISPLMTSSPLSSKKSQVTPKLERSRHLGNFAISPTSSPRPLSPILFSSHYGPSSLRNPGKDGDGTILLQNATFNISSELNETPVTKLSKQLAEFYVTSPINNSISPRANGHKIEEIGHNETRKQPDYDTSSGTSDGSLNATHGAKGFEESLLIDDKNILFTNDDVYTLTTPKRTITLPKKQPSVNYPRFHFPQGRPVSQVENDAALRRVCEVFKELPDQQCSMADMPRICQAANLPLYWKMPILNSLTKGESQRAIQTDFTAWWRAMTSIAHDEASRFVYTLSYGTRSYLKREDFYGIVMDVMHSHPGLVFCQNAAEFHDKYCDVVIARIFWNLGRTWSGKITAECLRKSDLLDQIRQLQNEDDINRSLRYFSYEHFYVVYCKFWEVDVDHDLKVSKSDMALHKDGAITDMVLDRIFSPAVRQRDIHVPKKAQCMNLAEFTNFLLADEDKTHPSSLEYWFRILDVDGDGLITMYDMEVFHGAILDKLHEEGIDSMSFKDIACQMFDMICPENGSSFRLSDLKKSPLSVRFINSLVNWRKFYTQEVTEGSERVLDETGRELTDWERFCSEEYETMMDNEDDVDENISVNLDDEDLKTNLSY